MCVPLNFNHIFLMTSVLIIIIIILFCPYSLCNIASYFPNVRLTWDGSDDAPNANGTNDVNKPTLLMKMQRTWQRSIGKNSFHCKIVLSVDTKEKALFHFTIFSFAFVNIILRDFSFHCTIFPYTLADIIENLYILSDNLCLVGIITTSTHLVISVEESVNNTYMYHT